MKRIALALALGALLAACGGGDEATSGSSAGDPSDGPSQLQGTPWALASGIEPTGIGVPVPSLAFGPAEVSGSAGCNRFSAPYEIDGDSLEIGTIRTTQKACQPPADTVESRFLAALAQVDEWELDDDELVLSGGDAELEFSAASPVGSWRATSLLRPGAIKSVLPGSEITTEIGSDGSISGSAGCNTYGGSYEVDGSAIEIGELSATEMACKNPAGVMEQEADFFEALGKAAEFSLDANGLTLLTERGTIAATFEPAP